jgi:hypothetical protein
MKKYFNENKHSELLHDENNSFYDPDTAHHHKYDHEKLVFFEIELGGLYPYKQVMAIIINENYMYSMNDIEQQKLILKNHIASIFGIDSEKIELMQPPTNIETFKY